jgi:hypothetical protein
MLLDEKMIGDPRKEYVDVWLNKGETTQPPRGTEG